MERQEQYDNLLFQLMAQLELATSSFAKWCSLTTFDQVNMAFGRFEEVYRDWQKHK